MKVSLEGPIGVPDLLAGTPVDHVEIALLPSRYCLACGSVAGHDGSDGRKFLARAGTCPAPSWCIASPSGAFLD